MDYYSTFVYNIICTYLNTMNKRYNTKVSPTSVQCVFVTYRKHRGSGNNSESLVQPDHIDVDRGDDQSYWQQNNRNTVLDTRG